MRRRTFLLLSAGTAGAGILRGVRAAQPRTRVKAKVVIVGGGFAGASCALILRRLNLGLRVTLVDPDERYVTCPMSNSVIVGLRDLESITVPRRGLERAGVDCVRGRASLDLLRETGVPINPKTGIPDHDPNTLETPIPGLFIAGVVVAGYDANKVFIENGRFHGDRIVARLLGQRAPAEPKLSAELDA